MVTIQSCPYRHEFGTFYPANHDGFYTKIGEGPGAGYNINVPWENGHCGDADYLAVWDHILIPVAKEFNPDIIIISAGFDAGFVVLTLIPLITPTLTYLCIHSCSPFHVYLLNVMVMALLSLDGQVVT